VLCARTVPRGYRYGAGFAVRLIHIGPRIRPNGSRPSEGAATAEAGRRSVITAADGFKCKSLYVSHLSDFSTVRRTNIFLPTVEPSSSCRCLMRPKRPIVETSRNSEAETGKWFALAAGNQRSDVPGPDRLSRGPNFSRGWPWRGGHLQTEKGEAMNR